MVDIVLRPSGIESKEKEYSLQLRYHETYGATEYITLAYVSEEIGHEIIRAKGAFWLFGDPREKAMTA